MTRSSLLLIGGVLAVSAVSLFAVRSTDVEPPSNTRNVNSHEVAAVGVFIPNLGQVKNDAFFYLKRNRSTILLKATTIEFEGPDTASKSDHGSLYFVSANKSPKVVGLESAAGFTGFRAVRYYGLYQGIDLRIAAGADKLSSTFVLAPGADPDLILFKAERATEGLLVGAPNASQMRDGVRMPVAASFEDGRYGSTRLEFGQYDIKEPVEIDFEIRF